MTAAGMDRGQAEAIARAISEADTSDLATKADLKAEIARLEAKLDTAIAELKAELSKQKAELFRFMYLQAAGIVGLTVALIKLLP